MMRFTWWWKSDNSTNKIALTCGPGLGNKSIY